MKTKLKAWVKSSRFVYYLYFYCGSIFLKILSIFVKLDQNLILFVSYGGQKYDDSPRVVYEYLNSNPISNKHKYIWAFIDPEKFPEVKNKVKIDTLKYYYIALQAGYWITNSSASRGLNFKKKSTKNILFQHGMAGIKKIGLDIEQTEKTYRQAFKEEFDMIFIEGRFEDEILTHAWECKKEIFFKTGLPRNDDLVGFSNSEIINIKKMLNIPLNKKVLLYAPTFREQSRDKTRKNVLDIPIDFEVWEKELGNEYVMIITAHYEVARLLRCIPANHFVVNAFKYPIINDLLKIADILISDYSSVVFDYSILERPILCYGYDYDIYLEQRGMYTDLNELFSKGVLRKQEDVLDAIKNINYLEECRYTRDNIKQKYLVSYGNAAEKSVKLIFQ